MSVRGGPHPYTENYDEVELQNEELRAQVAAFTEELQLLNDHLGQSRDDNEFLSQKIYKIENDLAEERIENASREHFLLRQNTPGLDHVRNLGGGVTRSRVSFYGITDQAGESSDQGSSPDTTRTESVFETTRPDSIFGHPNFNDEEEEEEEEEEEVDLDDTLVPRSVRASSVADHYRTRDHVDSVDSNRTLQRRSMSYHDMSDVHDRRGSDGFSLPRYHSYHLPPDEEYDYEQEVGYFDDELVPSTYYSEEHQVEECMGCTEADIKVRDLEGQIAYLDDQLEDKEKFIEDIEFELDEMKTQLRSVKLDKDIVEYELTQKVEVSKDKLASTESCLRQKDQAYMDLLERFVTLEKNHEDVNSKYKTKVKECAALSDKLSTTEFDLMLAEEQLQRGRKTLLESVTTNSSGGSSPERSTANSPTSKPAYNQPTYPRKSSMSNFESCGLDQQPLSVLSSSGSSLDLYDSEDESERLDSINKTRREAERHAQIQEMLCEKTVVSAYELYRITKELADLSESEETKENSTRGNDLEQPS